MKKAFYLLTIGIFLFSLAACAGSTASTETAQASTSLSQEGQLLLGTLGLESTEFAVSANQASALLPLWETLQSLESSGTSAQAEVQAVIDQIQGSMSDDQLTAITAMNLTPQDLAASLRQNYAATTSDNSSSTADLQPPADASLGGPAGGPPSGGNPPADMSGGMSFSVQGDAAGLQQAAVDQQVSQDTAVASDHIPARLIAILVEYLKKKIG
jgi:hypothetical protein